MDLLIGLIVAFIAIFIILYFLQKEDDMKRKKIGDTLFNATIIQDKTYSPEKVFETLEKSDTKISFLRNNNDS